MSHIYINFFNLFYRYSSVASSTVSRLQTYHANNKVDNHIQNIKSLTCRNKFIQKSLFSSYPPHKVVPMPALSPVSTVLCYDHFLYDLSNNL